MEIAELTFRIRVKQHNTKLYGKADGVLLNPSDLKLLIERFEEMTGAKLRNEVDLKVLGLRVYTDERIEKGTFKLTI